MSLKRTPLSQIEPDFDVAVQQLQTLLVSDSTGQEKAWKDLLATAAGQQILEFFGATHEIDQFAIARVFEEMFTETALVEKNIMANISTLGNPLRRNSPPYVELRLPDSSNVDVPNDVKDMSPLGVGGFIADPEFVRQWYLNPYFNATTFDSGVAHYGQDHLFWGYGKLKRDVNGVNITSTSVNSYTSFTTSDGNFFNRNSIYFAAISGSTSDPLSLRQAGWYGVSIDQETLQEIPVRLYRGDIVDKVFSATGRNYYSLISSETSFTVSQDDSTVWVNSELMTVTQAGLWEFPTAENFDYTKIVQDITYSDGRAVVRFGNDGFGKKPQVNDIVRWRYVISNGLADNISSFKRATIASTAIALDGRVDTMITPTVGGSDYLSAEEYKLLGPATNSARNNRSAVNPQDYYAIFKNYSTSIIDVQVDGQRNLNPSSPRYMNLHRVVTYPKFTQPEYDVMFSEIEKKTMFANYFFTDLNYPVLRPFNIRANVYCIGQVDFLSIRDNFIQPAILSLVDKSGSAAVGSLNYNLTLDDIRKTIKDSHPSIDYVDILEPSSSVIGNIISPAVERIDFSDVDVGAATKSVDYAVLVRLTNEDTSVQHTNILSTRVGQRRGQQVATLKVHFKPLPNFKYTPVVRLPTTDKNYLHQVEYALVKRNISTANWVWVTSWLSEAAILATMQPDKTVFIQDSTPDNDTPGVSVDTISAFNTCLPTVPVLLSDWYAEPVINIFSSDRSGI